MTPDEMKALIEKTRRIDGMWSKEQIAAHANRLADALEAALPFLRPEPSREQVARIISDFLAPILGQTPGGPEPMDYGLADAVLALFEGGDCG